MMRDEVYYRIEALRGDGDWDVVATSMCPGNAAKKARHWRNKHGVTTRFVSVTTSYEPIVETEVQRIYTSDHNGDDHKKAADLKHLLAVISQPDVMSIDTFDMTVPNETARGLLEAIGADFKAAFGGLVK